MRRIEYALPACLLLALPAAADEIRQSMTVDQAYHAIPHQRTRFDPSPAAMVANEKQFLDSFFGLTDLAVAERVGLQMAIARGAAARDNYDAILARLAALTAPAKLAKARQLVSEAVKEQREYLRHLRAGATFDANAPLVQSSHDKLIAAYGELMRIYPSENAHNKKAFFDHLCALDFI